MTVTAAQSFDVIGSRIDYDPGSSMCRSQRSRWRRVSGSVGCGAVPGESARPDRWNRSSRRERSEWRRSSRPPTVAPGRSSLGSVPL